MNLIEAHKSGKAFRRKNWSLFGRIESCDGYICTKLEPNGSIGLISIADLEADDYILKPDEKLLNRDDVEQILLQEIESGRYGLSTKHTAEMILRRLFDH